MLESESESTVGLWVRMLMSIANMETSTEGASKEENCDDFMIHD